MKAGLVAVLAIALGSQLAAQWLKQPTSGIPRTPDGKPNLAAPPPRTSDGKPDLSGLWTKVSPIYARNIVADLKPDEIQPWARELVEWPREDLGKDGMQVRCLPLGPAYATSATTGSEMTRIVQSPNLIVMLNPDLTYRQIWTDGRALEPEPKPRGWVTRWGVGRATRLSLRAPVSMPEPGSIGMAIPTGATAFDRTVPASDFRDVGDRGHVLRSRGRTPGPGR